MGPSRLQWASLFVIFVNALVVVFGFVTGSPLLPRAANVVLVVLSVVLMLITRVMAQGGYSFAGLVRPAWAGVVAAVAFFGGAVLFAIAVLAEGSLTPAANQRGGAGLALFFAAGALIYAGIRRTDEETV
ncbi:hypothetical protein ACFWN2_28410 [Lentzea sp. NPDC058436]|uniref:hypothetical protein n=1 Tax=Lentzea sp. NPDC058436 TaxID=3346499 RepID=UPI0036591B47